MRPWLAILLGALSAPAGAAPAVKPSTLHCSAIYLGKNGSAREAQKRTLSRKAGTVSTFEDEYFTYHFEVSALGLYLGFQEKSPVRLTEIKANLAAANPYFDIILPLAEPRKDKQLPGGEFDRVEVECK